MSGGKKATNDAKKASLQTGGEIDGIVNALVAAANDHDDSVRTQISASLYDIGFRQPGLVLSSCHDFLQKNAKADKSHRVILLKLMAQVIEEKRDEIPEEFGIKLIDLAVSEMTRDKDVVPDWQQAASSVLVTLGVRWPNQIMDELLKRFESGSLPHYFVMKTLGDFVAANAVATVPRLREVFSRVLPVLASIKHDNMRWVFAASMGHFCEAVVQYVANIDQGIDKTVTITTYSGDVFPAYEFMFSKWMSSGEPKVRLATIQAVGSIFAILARDQFESQVVKLIQGIIACYKKEKDHLPITHALASVLDCGVRGGGFKGALEPLLPTILITIHPLVCVPPDFSNSAALKNHNELLRCFEIIGRGFPDQLVTFLLGRIEQKDARTRIGALNVVKHIVTRLGKELEDKKGLLVSGVKPLVTNEPVLSVKKALAQVVIAMASHGYLLLEGGESLIEFVIRGSALPCDDDDIKSPKKKAVVDIDGVTETEIRNMCDNILNLITTTIPSMEPALWPFLFEALVPPDFVGALAVVCKCITYIASNKRANEADDYIIDFDRAVNLPKPSAIIARLFVLLNAPSRRGQAGIRILELLKSVGPILHPSLPALWDVTLPKMIQYLEDNNEPDKWKQDQWEELVLRLLSESIKITNDDEWNVALGTAMVDQIPYYNKDPELKKSAFKLLGMIMQKSGHKEFIRTKLDVMFASVDHTSSAESEGCAIGFGFCAATHLDIVLEKLQVVAKQHMTKKGGGLFSFGGGGKDKQALMAGGKKVKNTILLALGYVTSYAQPNLIASRIDVHVITPIKTYLPGLKSPLKKLCAIRMMNLVGKAVHPSHLQMDNPFIFKQRDDLIKIIQGYLAPANPAQTNNQVKTQGLNTCATLLLLEPPAPLELESSIVTSALNFFNMPVDGENDSGLRSLWDALNDMLSAILFNQTTVATLNRLVKHLETYLRSKEVHHRERAAGSLLHIVKKFFEYTKTKEKSDKEFSGVGHAVGILIPRCTDPQETIRRTSMETVQLSLYIDFMLKSNEKTPAPPETLRAISGLRERISTKEINEQFAVVHELSRILSATVSADELPTLLQTTMIGLNDSQQTSTNGTCVVLNGLIKQRGEELAPHVATVVTGLVTAMEGITSEATMNGSLHALRNLALHHLLLVVDHLLVYPMPHTTHVIKSFQVVAKDKNLILPLVNHLTDIINNKLPYDEKVDKNKKTRTPELPPMAATCALGEIMQTEELEEVITAHYPQFLGSLLLRFGTANQNQPKTVENAPSSPPPEAKSKASKVKVTTTTIIPSQQIVQAFKNFLECGKDEQVSKAMDDITWQQLEKDDFPAAISTIAEAVCKAHSEQMRGIFEFMLPYLRGNYTPQRIVTASVFAAFVNNCKDDRELLQKLVNSLLSSIVDPNVKLVTLRGLSNVVANGAEQANRYAPTIIDALVSSIDDQDEVIAMESMLGLSKVFGVVDESRVAPILVNICHRIRPAFEKANDDIRAASFTLFGSLWRFGRETAADAFYEQIHANLPSMILHVNDDSTKVQNACKKSLRQLSPLFRSEEVATFFNRKQFDVDRSLNYDDFLNELSKLMITFYLDRVNYYAMTSLEFFKSNWNSIKENAANFTGVLLGNLPIEKRTKINLNPAIVSRALIGLLMEKAPSVRKRTAEALSLLYTY
eukprot:Phypoly_transcript_00352.p1 GENE.Phypoly_transcript_00352~~Phypoly_transcript_00352.p1  ORF type:complete len:1660 (+),score=332.46 Phypoly_transcript_00352:97-5076(+)